MSHDDEHDDREPVSLRDCRLAEAESFEVVSSVVIGDRQMRQRIERIHCRLLERATCGRLTWDGDRIVRAPRGRGAVALPEACLRVVNEAGTNVASTTHDSPTSCPDNRQSMVGSGKPGNAVRNSKATGDEGNRDAMYRLRSDDERDPVRRHAHGGVSGV